MDEVAYWYFNDIEGKLVNLYISRNIQSIFFKSEFDYKKVIKM